MPPMCFVPSVDFASEPVQRTSRFKSIQCVGPKGIPSEVNGNGYVSLGILDLRKEVTKRERRCF